MKVAWSTMQIRENQTLKLENVICVTLSNHSDSPVTWSNNGVQRTLPARNKELNVPVEPFEIEINSNEFDVEIPIKFTGEGIKSVIVDYAKAKENCNQR